MAWRVTRKHLHPLLVKLHPTTHFELDQSSKMDVLIEAGTRHVDVQSSFFDLHVFELECQKRHLQIANAQLDLLLRFIRLGEARGNDGSSSASSAEVAVPRTPKRLQWSAKEMEASPTHPRSTRQEAALQPPRVRAPMTPERLRSRPKMIDASPVRLRFACLNLHGELHDIRRFEGTQEKAMLPTTNTITCSPTRSNLKRKAPDSLAGLSPRERRSPVKFAANIDTSSMTKVTRMLKRKAICMAEPASPTRKRQRVHMSSPEKDRSMNYWASRPFDTSAPEVEGKKRLVLYSSSPEPQQFSWNVFRASLGSHALSPAVTLEKPWTPSPMKWTPARKSDTLEASPTISERSRVASSSPRTSPRRRAAWKTFLWMARSSNQAIGLGSPLKRKVSDLFELPPSKRFALSFEHHSSSGVPKAACDPSPLPQRAKAVKEDMSSTPRRSLITLPDKIQHRIYRYALDDLNTRRDVYTALFFTSQTIRKEVGWLAHVTSDFGLWKLFKETL